jgi:hypothetical protein
MVAEKEGEMMGKENPEIDCNSLVESEIKAAQAILDDENLGKLLSEVRVDQDALKRKIDQILKSLSTSKKNALFYSLRKLAHSPL